MADFTTGDRDQRARRYLRTRVQALTLASDDPFPRRTVPDTDLLPERGHRRHRVRDLLASLTTPHRCTCMGAPPAGLRPAHLLERQFVVAPGNNHARPLTGPVGCLVAAGPGRNLPAGTRATDRRWPCSPHCGYRRGSPRPDHTELATLRNPPPTFLPLPDHARLPPPPSLSRATSRLPPPAYEPP
jgi:hypothetical protein